MTPKEKRTAKAVERYWNNPDKFRERGRKYYWEDPEKFRKRGREEYLRNREAHLIRARKYKHSPEGLKAQRERQKRYYWSHPEVKANQRIINQREREKLRFEVFSHYCGGTPRCLCCGETIMRFLTIDHINNDGAEERRNLPQFMKRSGHNFYRRIKKDGYPPKYQVLCMNCNWGKRLTGICPHKESLQA